MTPINNQGNKRKDDSAYTTQQPNGKESMLLKCYRKENFYSVLNSSWSSAESVQIMDSS